MESLRTVACDRCNRRKQRCDRKLPTCSQCVRVHADCRDGRGERIMTRTRVGVVQPKGFVEVLELRLEILQKLARQREAIYSTNIGSQIQTDGEQGTAGQQQDERPGVSQCANTATEAIENEDREHRTHCEPPTRLSSAGGGSGSVEARSRRHSPEIVLLSLSAMAEPNCRAAEFLKGISMPGIISAITESYGGNPQNTARIDALWDGITRNIRQSTTEIPERLQLPSEDAMKYVKTYYDIVDYRYPHLPEEGVMRGISAITASEDPEYEVTLSQDPAKVFMAYMVLAITPLVSDTYPVAQASFISIHILSKALKILDKVFLLEDGVDIIHCLLLLVIFSLHSSAAGSTWHLIGVAMKKCIALGFHREVAKLRRDTTEEDLENRRWAFWQCYFLDRLISCAMDRPFSINDQDITISLPGIRSPFPSRTTPTQHRQIHLYRYGLLQSKIASDKGNRPFSYHLNHLLHWETSAPVHFELYPIEQEEHISSLLNTLCLKAMTDQIIFAKSDTILLDRTSPLATDPGTVSSNTPVDGSAISPVPINPRELMSCAKAVIQCLNRRSMQRRSTLSWITGYTAIRACTALIYCLASSKTYSGHDLLDEIEIQSCGDYVDTGMDVLSVVSRQFPIMQEYRNLIANLKSAIRESFPESNARMRRANQLMEDAVVVGPNNIYALIRLIVESIFSYKML